MDKLQSLEDLANRRAADHSAAVRRMSWLWRNKDLNRKVLCRRATYAHKFEGHFCFTDYKGVGSGLNPDGGNHAPRLPPRREDGSAIL